MSRIQDEVDKHDAITIDDVPRIIAEWAKINICPECGSKLKVGIMGSHACGCDTCTYWRYS